MAKPTAIRSTPSIKKATRAIDRCRFRSATERSAPILRPDDDRRARPRRTDGRPDASAAASAGVRGNARRDAAQDGPLSPAILSEPGGRRIRARSDFARYDWLRQCVGWSGPQRSASRPLVESRRRGLATAAPYQADVRRAPGQTTFVVVCGSTLRAGTGAGSLRSAPVFREDGSGHSEIARRENGNQTFVRTRAPRSSQL